MSLEASHENAELESPTSATSAEIGHSSVVRENSEGEQHLQEIAPPLVPSDPDNLVALLLAWISIRDWRTSQTYLQTHSELLTEPAEQVLATLILPQVDRQIQERRSLHQQLLQAARQHGVEGAYESLLQHGDEANSTSNDLKELENQLNAWLQKSDWDASQTYLQAHPHLLTERAEQVLEQLKHAQPEEDVRSLISYRQALLHLARTWEIAGVYAYFKLAEQAKSIVDSERKVLLRQLNEWLATSEWEQAQAYLEEQPSLLTSAAESLLAEWWLMQQTHQKQIDISWCLQLLQHERASRITTAHRWLPDPVLLNDAGIVALHEYWTNRGTEVLEQAIECWQQALFLTLPDSPDRPCYLNNLGNGLRDRYARTGVLDDMERAITVFQQAVDATPANSPNLPKYLNNLGNGLRDRYEHTGVLDDLEQAIAFSQQAVDATPPNSPYLTSRLNNLGIELNYRYGHTGALVDLEMVITTWEVNWSLLHLRFVALPIAYQLGQQRQGVRIAVYLVRAHLERSARHHPNAQIDRCRALEVAEGDKSRLLTQLVGRGPLPLPTELSPEVAARERQLLSDLTALDTLELATHNRPATVQEEAGSLNRLQQRQANLRELEGLWIDIARVGPEGTEYTALRRGAASSWQELADLAQELGPATVLLSFFTTPDHILLFLVRAGWRGPRVSKVPLNGTGWDNLLERFFREVHLYAPGLRRRETWDLALHPLLAQSQRHLAGVERLILAPAGNGHLLPWSVLMERVGWRTSAGKPLPLVTLPALGVLSRLRRRPYAHIGPALVVGNPTSNLPYAEDEAREVAARFGTVPLLGSAATKEAVLSHLVDASLIHLATHAFFDPNNPLESGIVLANGVLTARAVLQHRLHADLLVLSACESGQVGSLGGEELAGLSQAFLQAGVRSLLVSLWQVNDPATATLMQAFYTSRQEGADKAQALRQAMTQLQQNLHWAHPYYWGAFVLLGDWD